MHLGTHGDSLFRPRFKPILAALAGLCWLALAGVSQPVFAVDFYVAPNGHDGADGRSPARGFRTLQHAAEAVRKEIVDGMEEDVCVNLMQGLHVLDAPLRLTEADSGRDGHRVVYRSHAKHTPIVSGGVHVPTDAWETATANGRQVWRATVKGLPDGARVLIVDGRRRQRARSRPIVPQGYYPRGKQGFTFRAEDIPTLSQADDAELHHTTVWRHYVAPILGIESAEDGQVAIHARMIGVASGMGPVGIDHHQPVWLENAIELLDEPGEWYYDRREQVLFYLPVPGETLADIDAVLPQLPRLLEVRGASLKQKAHDIHFQGITFAHGGWNDVNEHGWAAFDAGFTWPRKDPYGGSSNPHVFVIRAHDIDFSRCTFQHMGGVGLCLGNGISDSQVTGCVFQDISATGLYLGSVVGGKRVEGPEELSREIVVANNLFHQTGQEFYETAAIISGLGLDCQIVHNQIRDLPYMGIIIKRFGEYSEQSVGRFGNWLVAHNRVENVMKQVYDGGGIYTWENSSCDGSRSKILSNYITASHDKPGGLYFDNDCGYWIAEKNVIDHTPHYWLQGKGHDITVNNNFTDNEKKTLQKGVKNWVVSNTTVDASADWSRYPDAAATVAQAGLEPEYRHLLRQIPPRPTSNATPVVTASATKNRISLLETVRLNARVDDDGAPWGITNITWRMVSGPGDATFFGYRHTLLDPHVAFSEPGDYIVRLEVDDGQSTGHADVTITVDAVSLSENLALGRPTTASGEGKRMESDKAVDGDPTTIWFPGFPGRGWLQIDLEKPTPVRLIQLLERQKHDGGSERFTIKASNDPEFADFDVLGSQGPDDFESKRPDHQAVWTLPVASSRSYRYVRWEKNKGFNGLVTELRVFAVK